MKPALLFALFLAPPGLPPVPDIILPPLPEVVKPSAPPAPLPFLNYQEGLAEAVRTGKPLAVYVGVKPRKVPGFVSAYAESLDGVPSRAVLVGVVGPQGRLVTTDSSVLPEGAHAADLTEAAEKLKSLAFPPVRTAPVQYNAPQPVFFGGGFTSGSC